MEPNTVNYYSQCTEDKFLSEFIKKNNINLSQSIVEIGAGHPVEISNSLYWIEQGFNALLVEPNHALYQEQLNYHKDNDKVQVHQLIVSDVEGVTHLDTNVRHWALAKESDKGQVVGKQPLTMILDNWKFEGDIGIFSTDTEGSDEMIIDQLLQSKARPQFVLVEALTDETKTNLVNMLTGQEYELIDHLSLTLVFQYLPKPAVDPKPVQAKKRNRSKKSK